MAGAGAPSGGGRAAPAGGAGGGREEEDGRSWKKKRKKKEKEEIFLEYAILQFSFRYLFCLRDAFQPPYCICFAMHFNPHIAFAGRPELCFAVSKMQGLLGLLLCRRLHTSEADMPA
jgi:hypothetical protein